MTVRAGRVREIAESGDARARALLRLRDDPETFLATVQVGITVVGAAAGAFGGARFAQDLEPAFRAVPALAPWSQELAFAAVVAVVSYLSVVLGELVPKSLALRGSERYALAAARPMTVLAWCARPVVWTLRVSSNAVLALFGDRTTFAESRVSTDEIRRMVEDAARAGDVDPDVGEIAARALGFERLEAEDVMVHRRFVASVPAAAGAEEALRLLLERGHDRAPVVDERTDDVVGYVTWRDVVAASGVAASGEARRTARDLARPPHFVPARTAAVDVLRELQRRRLRIAVVVDDLGSALGIVTLDDLLEEVVGEMLAEHEAPPAGRIRREPDGSAVVDGFVTIRTVNRSLRTRLPEDLEATTVGGLCPILAGGRIPSVGEEIVAPDGSRLVPVEVSPRRVRALRVVPAVRSEA